MSITRRIAFGAAASWFSRGVTILMGLVLLPVLYEWVEHRAVARSAVMKVRDLLLCWLERELIGVATF